MTWKEANAEGDVFEKCLSCRMICVRRKSGALEYFDGAISAPDADAILARALSRCDDLEFAAESIGENEEVLLDIQNAIADARRLLRTAAPTPRTER